MPNITRSSLQMASCCDPEGWGPVSRIRAFDVTPCFEEGLLLSPILAGFTCLAFLNIIVLYNKEPIKLSKKSRIFLWAKLLLLVIAFIISLAGAVFIFRGLETVTVLLPYFLEPASIFAGTLFIYFHHTRFRTSSDLSLLFWPIYVLALIPWMRTTYMANAHHYTVMMLFKCIVGLLGIVFFILENFTSYDVNASNFNKEENPILRANVFSLWTFSWLAPLLRKGATTVIGEDDLPPLQPNDKCGYLGHRLEEALKKHILWKALFVAYGKPYAVAMILKFIQDSLAFLQPQLLRWLLAYISRYQEARLRSYNGVDRPTSLEGFIIAFLMFFSSVVQSVTLNQYFQRVFETGMRIRAGLVAAIYNKALIISNEERGKRATGDIVNLMSVDATRLQEFCTYGLILLSGPFQITLAFVSLYNLLGWAAFAGVAVMIISVPLNTYLARRMNKLQQQQMKNRDRRTRLMNELLINIKSIKLFAWENSFMRRVLETRNNRELEVLKQLGILTSCITTLWTGIPLVVAFISFGTAAIMSTQPLTADRIFPAISLFMLLQFPLGMFGQVTSAAVETVVSIRRLASFLNAQELQHDARKLILRPDLKFGDEVLNIKNADFAWISTATNPTLEGISLSVKMGEVIGVFGRVGAGKSSLLSAIIGDLVRTEGQIELYGSIAYVPQSPWIMSASVRENILFSHEFDEAFYNAVIEACALTQDLDLLPQGDHTEVGEKGITLSGGQRSRIALARAVYSRSDLILLDDCLSAVDSHVARHVFDNVIGPKGLLASKARILITNTVSFAKEFDRLVYLRRGIVLESGTYDAFFNQTSSEMYKLLQGHGSINSGTSTPFLLDGTTTPVTISEKIDQEVNYGKAKIVNPSSVNSRAVGLSQEHVEQGEVKRRVYREYINAASKVGFFVFLLTTIATQVAGLFASLTLRYWGEHNREAGDNSGMLHYLVAYGSFSLLSTTLGGVSAVIMWVFCGLRSAQRLHDSMLSALLHAPLTFFELTPTGRVLNLFSRDVYIVDQILPRVIQQLCRNLAVCMSIIVVICWSFPLFILFVIPLGWFYWRVMRYYLSTSRELKRLDAVSRSPIFAWFSESLAGVSSIRAFNQQTIFITNNHIRLDRNQICFLPSIYVNRWLAVRLEFVGATIIFVVATLAIVALRTTGVDAGLVGLVISYALNTTSSLNWVVRLASEVEQNIVSVERILYQTEVVPEAPHEIMGNKPDEDWPSQGEIEFRNYSARYRPELGLVLRDLTIKIKPGEKIGICGRTGAGKSSMLLALFRIIEPATGTIIIDGVDIMKLGLHDLRSAISIVPQAQDLFEGTLRENIDPVGEHTDMNIWTALGQVHLKEFVENLPGALDGAIQEGGAPLSAGQKQLLCFSRALLRKSKLLVLDEATSAVDLDTDQTVQNIIRGPAFSNVTMLTIAHRLNTIMESSRVLVMDAGKIIEFDSPKSLLSNDTTVFYSLAKEADLV